MDMSKRKNSKHDFPLGNVTSNVVDLLRDLSHLEGRCTFDLHGCYIALYEISLLGSSERQNCRDKISQCRKPF